MAFSALVIEDDEGTRDVLQQVLLSLGIKVTCAKDGATGLEHIQKHPYDVVFMDLLLPRVSGFELLEQRDQIAHLKRCPIVIMTAHSRMRDEVPLGPRDHFLVKPVPVRDLFSVIGHVIPDLHPVD